MTADWKSFSWSSCGNAWDEQSCRQKKERVLQNFQTAPKEDSVTIRMDITIELPKEMANEVERLGIYEFDRCTFDGATRRMTLTATTVLYRKGA